MKLKHIILFVTVIILSTCAVLAQTDSRQSVAVTKFSADFETKYAGAITEKVIEMLMKSKRFQVIDRTSIDKVKDELEFQKSEYFIDSKNLTQQGVLVAPDFILTGHIRQINISRMMNTDGSIGGYKASLSFTLKIDEPATGISIESQSFESKGAQKTLSPERAVDEAIRTLSESVEDYFTKTFPVNAKIVKIISLKGDAAASVLISSGKSAGLKEGDKFSIQKIEMLDQKPYPTDLGQMKITKVVSDDFSECTLTKPSADLAKSFNSKEKITCKLLK